MLSKSTGKKNEINIHQNGRKQLSRGDFLSIPSDSKNEQKNSSNESFLGKFAGLRRNFTKKVLPYEQKAFTDSLQTTASA